MPGRAFLFKKQGENRGSGPCLIPLRRACLAGASNLQGCGGVRQTSSASWFREVLDISNNEIIIQDSAAVVKRKIESISLGIAGFQKRAESSARAGDDKSSFPSSEGEEPFPQMKE